MKQWPKHHRAVPSVIEFLWKSLFQNVTWEERPRVVEKNEKTKEKLMFTRGRIVEHYITLCHCAQKYSIASTFPVFKFCSAKKKKKKKKEKKIEENRKIHQRVKIEARNWRWEVRRMFEEIIEELSRENYSDYSFYRDVSPN